MSLRNCSKIRVYEHVRKDTNTVFYVGKGKYNRPWSKVRNRYWKFIVAQAGFEVKIVAEFTKNEDACNLEKTLIKSYKKIGQCEANFTMGGEGMLGVEPWNKGKKITNPDWLHSFGNGFRGKSRPKHSAKMKALQKTRPFGFQKGIDPGNRRKVLCTTNAEIYPSIKNAAESLGLIRQSVSKVARGIISQTGGYKFRYLEAKK